MVINFISSKDNGEERVMHSKNDKIEIMINDKADQVIEKRFEPLLNTHKIGLKTSRRGNDL